MSNEVLTKVGNKAEWTAGSGGAYHVIKIDSEDGGKTGRVSYNDVLITGKQIAELIKTGPITVEVYTKGTLITTINNCSVFDNTCFFVCYQISGESLMLFIFVVIPDDPLCTVFTSNISLASNA